MMTNQTKFDTDLAFVAQITEWRHHLHAHPDLSLHEGATAAFVATQLTRLGIEHCVGVGGHGVVATLRRGASNRSVGLRADMDALPIEEQTGVAYSSRQPGTMHACGHDGHTASLLGAAVLLSREADWIGTIQLVFQPAEEGYGGAKAMLRDGLFDRFPMERIFGYHNMPGLPAGEVAVHVGSVMAQGARFSIAIDGHAGHAAMPHLCRDPMLAAGHMIVALQSIVARNVDPLETAVVSVCTINGGIASNQIPSRVTMQGTYRTQQPRVHAQVEAAIRRVAAGVAATFDVVATVEVTTGVVGVSNPVEEAALAVRAAEAVGLPVLRDVAPSMASEDFGEFLLHRPGALLWIGNGPADGGRELHSPHYDFNDAILPVAARFLASAAKTALTA